MKRDRAPDDTIGPPARLVAVALLASVVWPIAAAMGQTTAPPDRPSAASRIVAPAPFGVATADDAPPAGTAYYVDANGGDDGRAGTSQGAAWRSLDRASRAPLRPGDRLLLRRGRTWTGSLTASWRGTTDRPIVIDAYGAGAPPQIRGGMSCVVLAGSHLILRDIHVDGCAWAGIDVSGDANLIEHNVVTDNVAGVQVRAGALDNRVLDNEVRDNNRMSVLTRTPMNDDSGAFGILLNGDRTEVAHNVISGSDAFSYDYGRDGSAVEVYGGRDNFIHHNLAIDDNVFTELGNARSADNRFAYNVVRSSLASATFLVTRGAESGYGPVRGTVVDNNTVDLTGAASEGFACDAGCGGDILNMRNNIVVAHLVGYADAPFDENYDLFDGDAFQFRIGPHSTIADPLFVDPQRWDLHLRAASPAIDRGADLGYAVDFDGAPVPTQGDPDRRRAPDLGAYEYQR